MLGGAGEARPLEMERRELEFRRPISPFLHSIGIVMSLLCTSPRLDDKQRCGAACTALRGQGCSCMLTTEQWVLHLAQLKSS